MKYYSPGDSLYRLGLFETYCFMFYKEATYRYLFRSTKGIYYLAMENL